MVSCITQALYEVGSMRAPTHLLPEGGEGVGEGATVIVPRQGQHPFGHNITSAVPGETKSSV